MKKCSIKEKKKRQHQIPSSRLTNNYYFLCKPTSSLYFYKKLCLGPLHYKEIQNFNSYLDTNPQSTLRLLEDVEYSWYLKQFCTWANVQQNSVYKNISF